MQWNLSDKTAVVTGAGQGIGLAVVRALTQSGARVLGVARTVSDELREATKYVREIDVLTPDGPRELVAHALTEFGDIDVLVNNVGGGVTYARGFLDVDDDVWNRTFELNLFTTVRTTREALPSLLRRRGLIVNIGSVNAKLPDPALVHYSAAKSALSNLGKSLSAEFSPQGLRVNTILPGPVRTRLWNRPEVAARLGVTPAEFVDMVPKMNGMSTGRMIEPEEIGALVLLFASGLVPSITGTDHIVDGGMIKTI
jgi:NAD(P)-dependent dehydrogenase (short-subunit alcohol dehydrogenase family)